MKRINISKQPGGKRHLTGKFLGTLGFCTSLAIDVHHNNAPEWVEVVKVDLHLPKLPDEFRGKRIVHVSDLHCSKVVSGRYLRHCIERINRLKPDIVVLTGDYITHDVKGRFRDKVIKLLGRIRYDIGVYACLGNHDYGIGGFMGRPHKKSLNEMIDGMQQVGVNVLRNQSSLLEINGKKLWMVGLGDMWAGDFAPDKAFANVPQSDAVITLLHNPVGIKDLRKFSACAVMSGHTHGVKNQWHKPKSCSRLNRPFHSGLYDVSGTKLYVNRGLGRMGRIRLSAPPEITAYTLS